MLRSAQIFESDNTHVIVFTFNDPLLFVFFFFFFEVPASFHVHLAEGLYKCDKMNLEEKKRQYRRKGSSWPCVLPVIIDPSDSLLPAFVNGVITKCVTHLKALTQPQH